jgi:hypothetical protein
MVRPRPRSEFLNTLFIDIDNSNSTLTPALRKIEPGFNAIDDTLEGLKKPERPKGEEDENHAHEKTYQ